MGGHKLNRLSSKGALMTHWTTHQSKASNCRWGLNNTSYGRNIQSTQKPKLNNEASPCVMFIGLMLCVNQFKLDNEAL